MRPDPSKILAAIALLALATAAPTQTPTFQIYGQGCSLNGETCAIGNLGMPRVGLSFDITYSGPNSVGVPTQIGTMDVHPHLVFGFWNTLPGPIPPGLLSHQPPGCAGLVEPVVIAPAAQQLNFGPTPVYASMFPIDVPNDPNLVGAVFFTQWWTVVRDVTTDIVEAVLTSDGAIVVVGGTA